jgi:hypothetical protein
MTVPWPEGKRWAAAITHDLDVVDYWPAFTLLRLLELTRKGRLGLALGVMGSAIGTMGRDPVVRAAETVLGQEAARGISGTWFVLCGTPTLATMRAGDLTYRPEGKKTSRILHQVDAAGHEIGLHGSFATLERPELLAAQRARLEGLLTREVSGVRQHYVRMRPGLTQREMVRAGFVYDATYGFPDRNGFRLGVADIVAGWDAAADVVSGLEEVPLIWMDRAQSKYQGIEDPMAWIDDARDLMRVCRAAEGLWIGIWHPNLAPALGFLGASEAYAELLNNVLADDPFVATLGDLAAWRKARRSVRGTAKTADGLLEFRADNQTSHHVQIEDGDGKIVQTLTPTERTA